MEDLVAELEAVAGRADREGAKFSGRIGSTWSLLEPGVNQAARAWSGSQIGYHADVYIDRMEPAHPSEVWDAEHGPSSSGYLSRTRGDRWMQWDREGVFDWLLGRAGLTREDMKDLNVATEAARNEVRRLRDRVLPVIDAPSTSGPDGDRFHEGDSRAPHPLSLSTVRKRQPGLSSARQGAPIEVTRRWVRELEALDKRRRR